MFRSEEGSGSWHRFSAHFVLFFCPFECQGSQFAPNTSLVENQVQSLGTNTTTPCPGEGKMLLCECRFTLDTSWDLLLSVEGKPGAGKGTSRAAKTCQKKTAWRLDPWLWRWRPWVQTLALLVAETSSPV